MLLENEKTDSKLRLGVILGSTREGRFGQTVANWFMDLANRDQRYEPDLIDLLDFSLPSNMSRNNPDVAEFASRIGAADAFVIITPEYNHGYPAALKLAIDSVGEEWNAKPLGFVSYGGSSGGLRAVEQLRLVFAELRMATIRDCVSFHWAHARFQNGRPTEEYRYNSAAEKLLDELSWWGIALKNARWKRKNPALQS